MVILIKFTFWNNNLTFTYKASLPYFTVESSKRTTVFYFLMHIQFTP